MFFSFSAKKLFCGGFGEKKTKYYFADFQNLEIVGVTKKSN